MTGQDVIRPVCRDLSCDVQIESASKIYCAAHTWRIRKWLEKSKQALERYKAMEAKGEHHD